MAAEAVWVGWLEDLLTSVEIAARIGKSRQRLAQMVQEEKFPPPVGRVGHTDVWLAEDVDAWVQRHMPHPYRGRDTR